VEGKREEYFKAQRERLVAQGTAADTVKIEELPMYKTLRNGRIVRGGGGITPDVVVERDTVEMAPYLVKMVSRGVTAEFIYEYLDAHRDSLKSSYPAFNQFRDKFQVSESMLAAIVDKATAKGVELNSEEYERSKSFISRQVKAMIARNLFSESAYYEIMNAEGDSVLEEGVRIAINWDKTGRKILGY
jgi:carboxyl-terminal processing protease